MSTNVANGKDTSLNWDVFVIPGIPIPTQTPASNMKETFRHPISSTLIYGKHDVTTYNALRNSGAGEGDVVAIFGVGGLLCDCKPTRLLLLKILSKEPAYAGQLELKLKEEGRKVERRVVSAHLVELEKHGLVDGKYEIGKERPVTLKIFKITPRGRAVYNHITAFK